MSLCRTTAFTRALFAVGCRYQGPLRCASSAPAKDKAKDKSKDELPKKHVIDKHAWADNHQETRFYREIALEIYGYDRSVIASYVQYVRYAAARLDLHCSSPIVYPKITRKWSIIKSPFKFSFKRAEYELRRFQTALYLWNLTGTTADVFLEYVERNLAAGLGMNVHMESMEQLPVALVRLVEEKSQNVDIMEMAAQHSERKSTVQPLKRRRVRGKVHPDPETPSIEYKLDPFHHGHLRERGGFR